MLVRENFSRKALKNVSKQVPRRLAGRACHELYLWNIASVDQAEKTLLHAWSGDRLFVKHEQSVAVGGTMSGLAS